MTIKELEQELEIPRATIRFYEKENLISPKRGDNSYREYSNEDVVTLKKIIILRKIGLSVSDIKNFLEGFFWPFVCIIISSIFGLPVHFIGKKNPALAKKIKKIGTGIAVTFTIGLLILAVFVVK